MEEKEKIRIDVLYEYERALYKKGLEYIAGVDEAGRGPLAGPVVAAAVILPVNIYIEGVNDSKKLSAKKREAIYEVITKKAVSYGACFVDEKTIDAINIKKATHMAMLGAVNALKVTPQHILTDAEKVENMLAPVTAIIRGDQKSISIAAASIIAKVTRDRFMNEQAKIYPAYSFSKHKGYGTKQHMDEIKKYGICEIHRKSFIKL